jgi:hypothetical protein
MEAMNPEKPRRVLRLKWWALLSGLAMVLLVLLVRALAPKTRAVTFRFIDGKTGHPVTNVVVTPTHFRRSIFPSSVLKVFPRLPFGAWRRSSFFSASDRITVFGVPAKKDRAEEYEVRFSAKGFLDAAFYYTARDSQEARFWILSGPPGWSPVGVPPTTNFVTIWLTAERDLP